MDKICPSFSACVQAAFGFLRWTIAIASVLGTIALFTWIVLMIARKDRPK